MLLFVLFLVCFTNNCATTSSNAICAINARINAETSYKAVFSETSSSSINAVCAIISKNAISSSNAAKCCYSSKM